MSVAGAQAETVVGSIERVTFHNPDNGFAVLKVGVRGHRDLTTVVGHLALANSGEFIEATGRWVVNKEHGHGCLQLAVAAMTRIRGIILETAAWAHQGCSWGETERRGR